MDRNKKKMKFLATKLSALESELTVSREIFHAASAEVEKMFSEKYFPEQPVQNDEQQEESAIDKYSEETAEKRKENKNTENPNTKNLKDQTSAEKNADPEVKKMFKKIASQCHPDKLQDLDDGFEKDKKKELYQKARQALENNDIVLMADVAQDLGVEIPEISEAQLKLTENKIISIKKELSMIESTAVWHWFFTEDPKKKDNILKQLFNVMYGQYNIRS